MWRSISLLRLGHPNGLTMKAIPHLGFRQIEDFPQSVAKLMGAAIEPKTDLPFPHDRCSSITKRKFRAPRQKQKGRSSDDLPYFFLHQRHALLHALLVTEHKTISRRSSAVPALIRPPLKSHNTRRSANFPLLRSARDRRRAIDSLAPGLRLPGQ